MSQENLNTPSAYTILSRMHDYGRKYGYNLELEAAIEDCETELEIPVLSQVNKNPGVGLVQWSTDSSWSKLLRYADVQGLDPFSTNT